MAEAEASAGGAARGRRRRRTPQQPPVDPELRDRPAAARALVRRVGFAGLQQVRVGRRRDPARDGVVRAPRGGGAANGPVHGVRIDGLREVAGVWGAFIDAEGPWWVYLASGLLYLIAPFAIIRNVAQRPRVDREVVGAICAYIFIGMAFAFLFRTVALAQDSSFFGANGDGSMAETLFFSFTTLTTVGYGNLVPAANPGQSLAVIEMVLGPLFDHGAGQDRRGLAAQGGAGANPGGPDGTGPVGSLESRWVPPI